MADKPNVYPDFCTDIDDDGVGTVTDPNSGQKNAQPPTVLNYSVTEGLKLEQFFPRQLLNHLFGIINKWVKFFDFAIGARTYTAPKNIANDETVTESLEALDTATGDRTYTEQNYITNSEAVAASLDALDVELKITNDAISNIAILKTAQVQLVCGANLGSVGTLKWTITAQNIVATLEDNLTCAATASGADVKLSYVSGDTFEDFEDTQTSIFLLVVEGVKSEARLKATGSTLINIGAYLPPSYLPTLSIPFGATDTIDLPEFTATTFSIA
jgi:hypothetical protein